MDDKKRAEQRKKRQKEKKRNKAGKVIRYPKLPEEIIKTIQLAEQNAAEKKDDN